MGRWSSEDVRDSLVDATIHVVVFLLIAGLLVTAMWFFAWRHEEPSIVIETSELPEGMTVDEALVKWKVYQSLGASAIVPLDSVDGAVGLFKTSALASELHQVAVLHGWGDDMGVCVEIAQFLNRQEPGRYGCSHLDELDVVNGVVSMEN